jgi:hypothetical protein
LNPEDLDGEGEGVEGECEVADEDCGIGSCIEWVVLAIFIYLLTYRSRVSLFRAFEE